MLERCVEEGLKALLMKRGREEGDGYDTREEMMCT